MGRGELEEGELVPHPLWLTQSRFERQDPSSSPADAWVASRVVEPKVRCATLDVIAISLLHEAGGTGFNMGDFLTIRMPSPQFPIHAVSTLAVRDDLDAPSGVASLLSTE